VEGRNDRQGNTKKGAARKLKNRMRSFNSKNSEFSEIKANNMHIVRVKPNSRRRGDTVDFSQIRPDSRGLSSQQPTEFSNIVSQKGRYNAGYDPRAAYDPVGNQYSLDEADDFIENVPQGEWNVDNDTGDDNSTMRRSTGNSVVWNLDSVPSRRNAGVGQTDHWDNLSGTFSQHTGQEDSFSRGSAGHGNNNYMAQMGPNDESTFGSSMRGGHFFAQQQYGGR